MHYKVDKWSIIYSAPISYIPLLVVLASVIGFPYDILGTLFVTLVGFLG